MVFGDVAPEYSQGNFTYLDITDDSFYCVGKFFLSVVPLTYNLTL